MEVFDNILQGIDDKGLMRTLKAVENQDGIFCNFKGKQMINLSSNDYLGLATCQELKQEFMEYVAKKPQYLSFGSGSSRLLTGNTNLYKETEELLATWYGSESAIFFNSGYHANVGILPALAEKQDLILSDKLCHASIIDGVRLSQAEQIRYRHTDYEHLESILEKRRSHYRNVFIVTESIFSMDGDAADLKQLVSLKEKFNAILYVDEAHAVGVLGKAGLGLCEVQKVQNKVEIIIGTMGKAMASVGAYAILNKTLGKMLINKARTLIFTTALPSINMAWSKFIIQKMPSFTEKRKQLDNLQKESNHLLNRLGYKTNGSYIIPVVVGENQVAVQLAEHLQKKGFLVFPIRPPTVPAGTARLRISLTANLSLQHITNVMELIGNREQEKGHRE